MELRIGKYNTMFVHEVAVSSYNLYPCEIPFGETINIAAAAFNKKIGLRVRSLAEKLAKIPEESEKLLKNLFWLYFCVKFQPETFARLAEHYKKEIREGYEAIFYALHKEAGASNAIKDLSLLYSWAIVKIFHTTFGKSIAIYDRKFVAKCCQITFYELMGICVTEAFIMQELQRLIKDPILDELYPALRNTLKDKTPIKGATQAKKDIDENEILVDKLFNTSAAISAWKEYLIDTKHSEGYFLDQQDRIKGLLADTQKKLSLFQSKLGTLAAQTSRYFLNAYSVNIEDIRLPGDKTVEEMIMQNEPYSNILKTSQVSPAMKKFASSSPIKKSAAVPYKLPVKIGNKLHALKKQDGSDSVRNIRKVMLEEIKKIRSPDNGRFEKWLKGGTTTKSSHKLIDQWYKEVGHKLQVEKEYETAAPRRQPRDVSMELVNPDEKLKENSVFNAVFGQKINEALEKVSEKQNMKSKDYKELAQVMKKKALEPVKSESDLFETAPSLPVIKLNKSGEKQRLTNIIKKLSLKYGDDKNVLEERKKCEEMQVKLAKVAKGIKQVNKSAKERISQILHQTPTLY